MNIFSVFRNTIVPNTFSKFSSSFINTLQLNGKLASVAYDKELKKHADEFKREMAKIDNKSAYLREVFKRINLAGNEEERKQAMELMSDLSGYSLSEQEFTEFINGKKQIEL